MISDVQKREIEKVYKNFCMRNQGMPTRHEVAKQLNLELETIDEYHNSLTDDVIETVAPFKAFTNDMMQSVVMQGLKGNIKALELYFKLVYAFDGKKPEQSQPTKIEIEITNALDED